jgi:hypothetical protein
VRGGTQPEGKNISSKYRFGWEYNIKMGVKEIGWTGYLS